MPDPGRLASLPCLVTEIAPGLFDPLASDLGLSREVARGRRAGRIRQRKARDALSLEGRLALGAAPAERCGGMAGMVSFACRVITGEPGPRALMADLHGAGVTIALPLVEEKAGPPVFRRWQPGMQMPRGDWGVPIPPPGSDRLTPDVLLASVVGCDRAGFRPGHSGGCFDRTLAKPAPGPRAIGTGRQAARFATIFPQGLDIPLDVIPTEAGAQFPGEKP